MDGIRRGALSDDELDREFDAALNVDPSPEFVARVRMRVASEPHATGWRLRSRLGMGAAAAASCAVALAVIYLPATQRAGPPQANGAAAVTSDTVSAPISAAPPRSFEAAPPQAVGVPSGPVAGRDRRVETPRFPEVVISAAERRAFEVLLASVRDGRLPPMPEGNVAAETGLPAPAPLDVGPVIIEPLPQIARLE
jgi:hypothetical protein